MEFLGTCIWKATILLKTMCYYQLMRCRDLRPNLVWNPFSDVHENIFHVPLMRCWLRLSGICGKLMGWCSSKKLLTVCLVSELIGIELWIGTVFCPLDYHQVWRRENNFDRKSFQNKSLKCLENLNVTVDVSGWTKRQGLIGFWQIFDILCFWSFPNKWKENKST